MKVISKMFLLSLVAALYAAPLHAQIFPNKAKKGEPTVLASVEVKNDEGCTQATKRAADKFKVPSLSKKNCEILLARHGRLPHIDDRNPLFIQTLDTFVYPGDVFMYVTGPHGKGWILQPKVF